jgi:UDP-glucose 4-epimerase
MQLFVTGSASGLAQAVLPKLCAREGVTRVVGLDKRPIPFRHAKFSDIEADVHAPDLPALMAGSAAVIHLAFGVMRNGMSDTELFHNNVTGTLKVFAEAEAQGIRKVINLSSVSVYGAGLSLDESAPLQPSSAFTYAQHKAAIEREAALRHPQVVHLRSHLIFGRHAQPFLRSMVGARFFIAPRTPYPVLQVVHESDVAEAISRCLDHDVHGPFNLAAPEATSLPALVRHGSRHRVLWPLPLSVVRGAVAVAKSFGSRDEFTWLDVMDTSLTVRCNRARTAFGWEPKFSAWQARDDMASD